MCAQVNPAIVIPSYWAETDQPTEIGEAGVYDHVTPITKPVPELETCLRSLEAVRGVLRVIVLLVAPAECEESARARVDAICRQHLSLSPIVIGSREGSIVSGAVEKVVPRMDADYVSLRGYGAIRNMGLAIAAMLNHDVVVFLNDDEVVLDENFLIDAVYGIGSITRQGIPIRCKSGLFLDWQNSPYANVGRPRWSERLWSKRIEFNQWMHRALTGTRISRANSLCGGCFVVSAEAYTKVPFDPIISRGEDLDYLFNLRMNGIDVWIDNAWRVRHLPPDLPQTAEHFVQGVYRWSYETEKIAAANATPGIRQIRAESLRPYPSGWISPDVHRRIRGTAFRRALVGPQRLAYLKILLSGHRRARAWAKEHSTEYFSFQTYWPRIMSDLWDSKLLAKRLLNMASPKPVEGGSRS